MCILQDFESITPNLLCRTFETVQGGGIICLLLNTMKDLKQLYTITMDYHKTITIKEGRSGALFDPLFNKRFILSLSNCKNCLVIDDEMNVLPLTKISHEITHQELAEKEGRESKLEQQNLPVSVGNPNFRLTSLSDSTDLATLKESLKGTKFGALINLAATLDQARCLISFVDCIAEKTLNTTVSLTASRGRGKSATLGLTIAAALLLGYSNIVLTAPAPDNVKTIFEFIQIGLLALGYSEPNDFQLIQGEVEGSEQQLVRVNVHKEKDKGEKEDSRWGSSDATRRQVVQFILPHETAYAKQAELLIIDEAAAIPLPVIQALMGSCLIFLSSTVSGYEGTGRSLSLKLIKDLRGKGKGGGRKLLELNLEEPIRYGVNDPIENWLVELLCLGATVPYSLSSNCVLAPPDLCHLYLVNKKILFSFNKNSELFLSNLISLFVSSHYKNSPNDLLLLADNPNHFIFILCPPVQSDQTELPDIFVALQISIEGTINKEIAKQTLERGSTPSGDLIPWTLSQYFIEENFASLNGARIVRIATHPKVQRLGYGLECLKQFIRLLRTQPISSPPSTAQSTETSVPPLLTDCEVESVYLSSIPFDYIGVAYGVSLELFRFYDRLDLKLVYLRQSPSSLTGEFSGIMLKSLSESVLSVDGFVSDFNNRFLNLLSSTYHSLPIQLTTAIAMTKIDEKQYPQITPKNLNEFFTEHDLLRLERYSQQLGDLALIRDLLPILSYTYFTGRFQKTAELSSLQAAVLLALGSQRQSIEKFASSFSVATNQALSVLNKSIIKVNDALHSIALQREKKELSADSRPPSSSLLPSPSELPEKSLQEELEEGARKTVPCSLASKMIQNYSLEDLTEEDISNAVKGKKLLEGGSISVKRKDGLKDDKKNNKKLRVLS